MIQFDPNMAEKDFEDYIKQSLGYICEHDPNLGRLLTKEDVFFAIVPLPLGMTGSKSDVGILIDYNQQMYFNPKEYESHTAALYMDFIQPRIKYLANGQILFGDEICEFGDYICNK